MPVCHHHSEFFGNSVYVSCVFLPFIRCLLLFSPILFNLVSGPLGFFCFCAFAIIFYKMVLQPRNLTLTIPFPSHPIEIIAQCWVFFFFFFLKGSATAAVVSTRHRTVAFLMHQFHWFFLCSTWLSLREEPLSFYIFILLVSVPNMFAFLKLKSGKWLKTRELEGSGKRRCRI